MQDLSAPLLAQSWIRIKACRHGFMLYNANDTQVGKSLDTYGEATEADIQMILPLIQRGDVVVDAGAHIGTVTLPMARAVGAEGRVYAFEPQSLSAQMLNANAALNNLSNIIVRQTALGNHKSRVKIKKAAPNIPIDTSRISLLAPKKPTDTQEEIGLITIDSLGLDRLNLLKIDVEGMEQDVLEGGRKTITHHRPFIFLENNIPDKSPKVIQTMWDMGYTLYWCFSPLFNPENYFCKTEDIFRRVEANMFAVPTETLLDLPPSYIRVTDPNMSGFDVFTELTGQSKTQKKN